MIQLASELLPRFKNFIETDHGFSTEYHGEINEIFGWTVQGNLFSVNECWDVSHIMLKEVEKNRLEIILASERKKQ